MRVFQKSMMVGCNLVRKTQNEICPVTPNPEMDSSDSRKDSQMLLNGRITDGLHIWIFASVPVICLFGPSAAHIPYTHTDLEMHADHQCADAES